MKTQILEKLNDLKTKSGKSYENVHEALGYATSTVHRWHKGESEPDLDQLTALVEYYGGSMTDLFAAVGQQELAATQTIGYQGADAMVTHYEERLKSKDERYQLSCDHHDKSVSYLKDEIKRLRDELDIANRAALEVTGKKHIVFWVLACADVILAILLFVALRTGPVF